MLHSLHYGSTGGDAGEGESLLKYLLAWTVSEPLSNPAIQGLAWVLLIMRPLLFSFLLVRVCVCVWGSVWGVLGQASYAGGARAEQVIWAPCPVLLVPWVAPSTRVLPPCAGDDDGHDRVAVCGAAPGRTVRSTHRMMPATTCLARYMRACAQAPARPSLNLSCSCCPRDAPGVPEDVAALLGWWWQGRQGLSNAQMQQLTAALLRKRQAAVFVTDMGDGRKVVGKPTILPPIFRWAGRPADKATLIIFIITGSRIHTCMPAPLQELRCCPRGCT